MGMVPDFLMSPFMDYLSWICYVEIWVCNIGERGEAGWERCLVGVMGRKTESPWFVFNTDKICCGGYDWTWSSHATSMQCEVPKPNDVGSARFALNMMTNPPGDILSIDAERRFLTGSAEDNSMLLQQTNH